LQPGPKTGAPGAGGSRCHSPARLEGWPDRLQTPISSGSVSVIDTESRTVTVTIPTDSPISIGVLQNGRKAYVTNLNAGT